VTPVPQEALAVQVTPAPTVCGEAGLAAKVTELQLPAD